MGNQSDVQITNVQNQTVTSEDPFLNRNNEDDSTVEMVWQDIDRKLPRERVGRVVAEFEIGFKNAAVKTFVPILVHRLALERLRKELDEMALKGSFIFDENGLGA